MTFKPSVLEIQLSLFKLFAYEKSCRMLGVNCYAMNRLESDFIAVTEARFLHEVEIKLSKSDFRADFKKETWKLHPEKGRFMSKHEAIESGLWTNYFWFACPAHLLDPEEVPPYAGLIWVWKDDAGSRAGELRRSVKKSAPRLHSNKAKEGTIQNIARSMMYRAWALIENDLRRNDRDNSA